MSNFDFLYDDLKTYMEVIVISIEKRNHFILELIPEILPYHTYIATNVFPMQCHGRINNQDKKELHFHPIWEKNTKINHGIKPGDKIKIKIVKQDKYLKFKQ